MASAAAGIVFVIGVAILVVVAIHRLRLGLSDYPHHGGLFGDDDAPAGVREPRRPPPTGGAATALAEPDEDAVVSVFPDEGAVTPAPGSRAPRVRTGRGLAA